MVDSVEAQRPDVTAVDLNARTNGKSEPGNRALRRAAARQSKEKGNIK